MSRLWFLVLILSSHFLQAQTVTRFFDSEFLVTEDRDKASYAGIIKWNGVKWQGVAADDSSRKRMVGTYLDSLGLIPDGPFVYYYPNGKKMLTGYFKYGKMDGKWIEFSAGGTKISEQAFEMSLPKGKYTLWYDNGAIKEEGEYQNDQEKAFVSYHRNGKPACIAQRVNDTIVETCYSEAGEERDCTLYKEVMPERPAQYEDYVKKHFHQKYYNNKWKVKEDVLYLFFNVDENGELSYEGIYRELVEKSGKKGYLYTNRIWQFQRYKFNGIEKVDNPQLISYFNVVLKTMSPWKPAYRNNIAVSEKYMLPIYFE